MGNEKDMVEKTLESLNDVFADIVNVLLFNGEEIIKEDDLEPATLHSVFKADGKLHEQERDVAKYWKKGNVRIALCGIENQSKSDSDMPLRILSYDGASYKEQVIKHIDERNNKLPLSPVYPTVTIVLYFGKTRWRAPKTLLKRLGKQVPPELAPYVNDYKIQVFEISFLKPEQVAMFKSDFGIVADFFVQSRTNPDYKPPEKTIRHVDELLKMMEVFAQDKRYGEIAEYFRLKKEVSANMCQVMDKAEKRGEVRAYWQMVLEKILTVTEAAKKLSMSESDLLLFVKAMNLPMP